MAPKISPDDDVESVKMGGSGHSVCALFAWAIYRDVTETYTVHSSSETAHDHVLWWMKTHPDRVIE